MNAIEQLKRDRERAIIERHENMCRIADYFNIPSLKGVSAEIALRDLQEKLG